jgi:hypothetical protein
LTVALQSMLTRLTCSAASPVGSFFYIGKDQYLRQK